MAVSYSYTVRWTDKQGHRNAVIAMGRETKEKAREEADAMAREQGWTPRRWWQFWRRHLKQKGPPSVSRTGLVAHRSA